MNEPVERAIADFEGLPEDEQDATVERLLADLADEQAWATRLADADWEAISAQVSQEIGIEVTIGFEDLFPPSSSQP